MQVGPGPTTWSQHDATVWTTCQVLSALLAGEPERLRPVSVNFPLRFAPDEQLLSAGGFDLLTYRPVGAGTYVHRGTPFLTAGQGALAAAVLTTADEPLDERGRARAKSLTIG